jgi:hypothetical protein
LVTSPSAIVSSIVGGQLNGGVFVGPGIRKLMFDEDEDFLLTMTEVEREAWITSKGVVTKFLWNSRDPDYLTIVADMLEKFKVLRCLMGARGGAVG